MTNYMGLMVMVSQIRCDTMRISDIELSNAGPKVSTKFGLQGLK
jgi:hypothetical protein